MVRFSEELDSKLEILFEKLGYGITAEDLVITSDTLQNFKDAAKNYASYKNFEEGKIEEFNYLVINKAQVRAGDTRSDVIIIDLGDKRYCYKS